MKKNNAPIPNKETAREYIKMAIAENERFNKQEVTIQNDKKLYTCTKEILKYRIAGMQMIEIQIGRMLCSPEALKTTLKNQVGQNAQPSVGARYSQTSLILV